MFKLRYYKIKLILLASDMFQLHPTLAKDSFLIGEFPLSTCRLINDCQFPWLILVPRVAGVSEMYELSPSDQVQLLRESSWLSSQLAKTFQADKMNVAALGNQVPQLHFHHVVRYKNDSKWPNPIWGEPSVPYTKAVLQQMQQTLMIALRGHHQMPFDWKMN